MVTKYFIIFLCIELSLAHRHFDYHSYSDSYSDEDYSKELPELPKPPKPIRKHNVKVENPIKEKPRIENNAQGKNLNKTVSQYEVTENVIDVPNNSSVNGLVDSRFMLNKPLNQGVNNQTNRDIVNVENKEILGRENELERLQKEYINIVKILDRNQDTNGKMIDLTMIRNRLMLLWNNVQLMFRKLAADVY